MHSEQSPWDVSLWRLTSVDCLILFCLFFLNSVHGYAVKRRKSDNGALREKTGMTSWLYYYFTQLSTTMWAISCSNNFSEDKKLTWHISHFSPCRKIAFFCLQFIQLQIYSIAKSTIWYSLSLFFSLWRKSNHSKLLLMVIIATALYWSSGPVEWKQTKKRRGGSLCAIIFGLLVLPRWRCSSQILR